MKRLLSIIFAVSLISICACRKLPQIGDLAGQWRIESIDYPDGSKTGRNGYYYCFYRDLAQLSGKIVAMMDYERPEITLEFKKTNPEKLKSWGITVSAEDVDTMHWYQHYHIDRLKGSSLIMTTPQGSTITLSKF